MKKIIALLFAVILAGAGYYYYSFLYTPALPAESGLKTQKLTWQYKSKNYSLTENLYQSIDNYYAKRPKGIFQSYEDRSIQKYLDMTAKDTEVQSLANKLQTMAAKEGLNEDQTVDFTAAFVQAIPYDDVRAKTDLTHPRYPYEVLYENKGICSDKTLLALALLRDMGYGTAVFMWDTEQHMAAGVLCPKENSNYASGYCIVETTAVGAKIGIVPDLQPDNLKAIGRATIASYSAQNSGPKVTQLSTAQLYSETSGKIYHGIRYTLQTENEINAIQSYLKAQKITIEKNEQQLTNYKTQLNNYYRAKDYTAYNKLVPVYNNLVGLIKKEISEYNAKVTRYNYLIKQ